MLLRALIFAIDSLTRPFGALPPGAVDGWAATLRGETFGYHSAHPTARASLLVRSLDSTNAARWVSAPVPPGTGGVRHVVFLAAMDVTDPGQAPVRFWVTVNGAHRFALPQPTTTAEEWRIPGPDGISLGFRRLMIDKFDDVHGVFTLDVPAAFAPAGSPVTIQVQGENAGRMSWFILYTVSMQPTVSAHAEQMLAREAGSLMQTVRLDAWNPFDSSSVAVAVNGTPRLTTQLASGRATFRVNVPAVRQPGTVAITLSTPGARAEFPAIPVDPVVPREIHLINHAHLDIGYTDVHEKVRDKHWRGLDSALVYVERSRANGEEARFRWNVEGLWPLQAWLSTRSSADTTRFFAAVRRGDIAIGGFYANILTGLSGSEELVHMLDYARRLRAEHGVAITTAMSSDIPGYTWGLVPALAQQGIRYLSSGPNYMPGPTQDGDRIGRALEAWGDRPFWWMGPSGRDSVLVMTAGRGYSWVSGWPGGRITLQDANVMSEYMDDLRRRGYPYEIVQVRYAIGGDNGFPDGQLADVVRQWNERFVSPRLVISTLPKMFAAMEQRYGAVLPHVRGDLTGYWEDGAMSSAREQVMARASAARLVQAGTLAALRGVPLPAVDRDGAWRSILLWEEHTWGAAGSISDPDSPESIAQWNLKERFALDADSATRAVFARASAGNTGGRGVDIWNTHEFPQHLVVVIPDSLSRDGNRVLDERGTPVPSQRLHDGSLAIQPILTPMGATRVTMNLGTPGQPLATSTVRAAGDSLFNGRVVVRIDASSGSVASVRWQGRELVDTRRGGWNRYRYLPGRDTSRAQDASHARIEVLDDGPLVATLRVTSDAPGAVSMVRDISLHAGDDAVHLVTYLDKAKVRDKEAVHFAFPLAVPGGTVRMEQGLAIVRPDSDQATGANRNLYPVQRWLDASNAGFGVTLVTPDLPLWELNGLTAEAFKQSDGREEWMRRALPGTEFVAYAMNNYWHTNYKADQPGLVSFRVSLLPHGPFDAAAATRAGVAASEPPVVLAAATGDLRAPLFGLDNPRVLVSSVTPSADGTALLVRLWNPGGRMEQAGLQWSTARPARAWLSSPAEERGVPAPSRIDVPPFGAVTIRVERTPPPG